MQPELERLQTNRSLLFFLLGAVFVILTANVFGSATATTVTDLLYVPVSGELLVLAVAITVRFRAKGDHGKAYLFFVGFVALWFVAEVLWMISDLTNYLSPFPAEIDWLYLGGYPLLFLFSIYYLKPMQKAISKKMLACASLATITFLVPTLYITHSYNPDASMSKIIWAGAYPVADAVVLFPAILGLMLFFKGTVTLFWSLACIAIVLNIVADSGFFFLQIGKPYYSGHPIDILYLWSYILFSFGIYSHIRLYKKPKTKSYGNIDDLK